MSNMFGAPKIEEEQNISHFYIKEVEGKPVMVKVMKPRWAEGALRFRRSNPKTFLGGKVSTKLEEKQDRNQSAGFHLVR